MKVSTRPEKAQPNVEPRRGFLKHATGMLMSLALVRSVAARVLPKRLDAYDQELGKATTAGERRSFHILKGYAIVGKLADAGKIDKLFALAEAEGIKLPLAF